MEPDAVPPDLAAALREAGYRVAGPVGVGSHGPAWAAVGREGGSRAGTRVVVTLLAVPAGPPGARWRERLAVLRGLTHEHLAEVVDVVPIDAGSVDTGRTASAEGVPGSARESSLAARWAVLLAEIPGVNLATLLAARPPLADGEVVTLVVPLAQALAALHRAGLVHGDVSPANIVVRPDGRPVLVDLLGAITAAAGTRDGRGTPGFAAPDVERGNRPGPDADVHALARVALAGLDPHGGPGLRGLLEGACAADPTERPSAVELARRCYREVAPEPLGLPDAAVLARTTLARLATEPGPRSVLTARPAGSRHRAARRGRGVAARMLAIGTLAVVAVVVAALVARGPAADPDVAGAESVPLAAVPSTVAIGPATAARPSTAQARRGAVDPVAAAVALTERRAVLLASDDPAVLAEVEIVGGRAHLADLELLAGLRAAGLRIDGLSAAVASAKLVDAGAGVPRTQARVEVNAALTAHRRLAADGAVQVEVPAQPARTVLLTLSWTSAGWRVAHVAATAAGPVSGPTG